MERQTANSIPRLGRSGWVVALFIAAALIIAAFAFDGPAHDWMNAHQNPSLKTLMRKVSTFGDWPEHVAVGLLLIAGAWWRGNRAWRRVFVAMIVACALAGIVARVIKIGTARARPSVKTEATWNGPRFSSKYNAFPSGHTAASTAFFATLAFASWRIGSPLLVVPLLIAFSRMYVAAHYFSDVVCAAILGLACAFLTAHWLLANRTSAEP